MGALTLLFAGEIDDGSAAWQRERGLQGATPLAARFAAFCLGNLLAFAVGAILFMVAASVLGSWSNDRLFDFTAQPKPSWSETVGFVTNIVLCLACCYLASVTAGSAFAAVVLTGVYALSITGAFSAATTVERWLFRFNVLHGSPFEDFDRAAMDLSASGTLVLVATAVALRWPETPWLDEGFWPWAWRRWNERREHFGWSRARVDGVRPMAVLFFGDGLFGRLVWQELRPWVGFFALGATAAAAFLAKSLVDGRRDAVYGEDDGWTTVAVCGWALLCGLASFRGEAVNDGFRHPAERGLSPTLWLAAKLTVWLPASLLGLAVFFALPPCKSTDLVWTPFVTNAVAAIAFVGLFVLGMGWAAALRKSLVALVAALVAGCVYVGLVVLLVETDVPWWWSIAPTPLLFLIGLRLYVGAWLRGEEGWRLSRPALLFRAPALALLGMASVVHRATAVPAAPSGDAAYALLAQPPAAAAVETADLYRQAIAAHRKFVTFAPNYK
ncbi:MAG: hypothetical protein ACRDD1_03955, partial [Planctomycetia bacterium]